MLLARTMLDEPACDPMNPGPFRCTSSCGRRSPLGWSWRWLSW